MPRGPAAPTQFDRHLWAIGTVLAEVRTRRGLRFGPGVPWRPAAPAVVGPQCRTYTIETRPQDQKKVLARAEEFAQAARSQMVRVYRDHGVIRVEFTLPKSEWKDVVLSTLPDRLGLATIGQQARGPLARMSWVAPHKAVFGSTSSGKTTLLADLVISLARTHQPDDFQFLILNPKNDPVLRPFNRLVHLAAPMADTYDDCANLLRFALAEMECRRQENWLTRRRLVVVVDEIAQLTQVNPEAGPMVTQLSQLAGSLNINLVCASQAANPTVFGSKGSLAKTNFGSRIVFQVPKEQAYLATGLRGQETEKLGGDGDGLIIWDGNVTRFRAALPSPADYDRLPRTEVPPMPSPDRTAPDRLADRDPKELQVYNDTYDETQTWTIEDLAKRTLWAVVKKASAHAVRQKYGGGQKRADTVSKLAAEMRRLADEIKQRNGEKQ